MTAIGFTGTRYGMSRPQRDTVGDLLCYIRRIHKSSEFHHGCCVGADTESAMLARELGYTLIGHPASNTGPLRAAFRSNMEHRPINSLKRNKIIVDSVLLMIAAPLGIKQRTGGTWSTVRYARKVQRPTIIVYRDGSTMEQNCEALK